MIRPEPVDPVFSSARTRLLISQPWFASLALRLRTEHDESKSASTDGRVLRYDPTWFAGLDMDTQESVIAHEVMHCALLHMTRRGERDPQLWNAAADHVINLELVAAGFPINRIPGILADPRFAGQSTEAVYATLQREQEQNPGAHQQQDPLGSVCDAQSDEADEQGTEQGTGQSNEPGDTDADLEADWTTAVAQASRVAEKHGHMPGGMRRAIETRDSQEDWRAIVAPYLTAPSDYSWTTPNRRHIHRGLYLPGAVANRIPHVVFAVDTSGSVDQRMLNAFAAGCNGILGAANHPSKVSVVYCDATVQHVDVIEDGSPLEFKPHGGGGTAFRPVFDYLEAQGETPDVLFYLTDLECYDLPEDPGYPVVWVAPVSAKRPAPFGLRVTVDADA